MASRRSIWIAATRFWRSSTWREQKSSATEPGSILIRFFSCRSYADDTDVQSSEKVRPMTHVMQMPVQPGEHAPDFAVPAVRDERTITLADYRGKSPLLLGLFP